MKSFIITLKNHKLSEKLSDDCVNQAKKFGIRPEIFDAIEGKDWQTHIQNTGLSVGKVKKKMSAGHFGNFFSHYYLWNKCKNLNEPLIILEHDGYFIRELPNNILFNFEDILKLDSENPYDPGYSINIKKSINQEVAYHHSIKGILREKSFGWYTWGSYGYIIKPSGAEKLISWVKINGFTSTDNLIADKVLNVSICKPSILRLHPMFNNDTIKAFSTA